MCYTIKPEARSHVLGRVGPAQVRREGRFLPRYYVAPHRHAFYNLLRRDSGDGCKDNYVVLRTKVAFARRRLRADVLEGYVHVVKSLPPPTFGLCGEPGMHEGDARRRSRMGCYDGPRCKAVHLQIQ